MQPGHGDARVGAVNDTIGGRRLGMTDRTDELTRLLAHDESPLAPGI